MSFVKEQVENDNFGRVEALDEIVKKFLAGEKEAAVEEAEKVEVSEDEEEYAKYYIKVMKKTIEKGDDYPKNEHDRIERMIKTKSVHKDKVKTFAARINILEAFLPDEE